MRKLYLSNQLNLSPKKIILIGDFVNYCIRNLPIRSKEMHVYLVDSRSDYRISTTAYYAPGQNVIAIYCKNRALVDICRSIAHEMTHMLQDELGMLEGPIQDVGGFHENHANAKAGELIKSFAKSKPKRKGIYEGKKKRLTLA